MAACISLASLAEHYAAELHQPAPGSQGASATSRTRSVRTPAPKAMPFPDEASCRSLSEVASLLELAPSPSRETCVSFALASGGRSDTDCCRSTFRPSSTV
jgi:hypothetical protein